VTVPHLLNTLKAGKSYTTSVDATPIPTIDREVSLATNAAQAAG
jgi:hypothetical protein